MINLCRNEALIKKYNDFYGDLIVSSNDLEECLDDINYDTLTATSNDNNIFGRLANKFESIINCDENIKSFLRLTNAKKIKIVIEIDTIQVIPPIKGDSIKKTINLELYSIKREEETFLDSIITFETTICNDLSDIEFWCNRQGNFEKYIVFNQASNTGNNVFKSKKNLPLILDESLEKIVLKTFKDNFEIE